MAQRYDTSISYLKFIDGHHETAIKETWDFMYTYTNDKTSQAAMGNRKVLENTLNKVIRYVEKEKPYDVDMQQAALTYFYGNLAIVKEDFVTLLKSQSSKEVVVYHQAILKAIRQRILTLRTDYDAAVIDYGKKYDIKIVQNRENLALKMEKTIALYDHYNEVRLAYLKFREAEFSLWNDVPDVTKSVFINRRKSLDAVVITITTDLKTIQPFNNDTTLIDMLVATQHKITQEIIKQTPAVLAIIDAYSTNERNDIITKTNDYNAAKTALNIVRRDAYTAYDLTARDYLVKYINLF